MADIDTTYLDSDNDFIKPARPALLEAVQRVNQLTGNSGTDYLRYLSNGTGALSTAITSRFRNSFDVKEFGAVGDGTADDTTAINNALIAASGRILYFPKGTYKISSILTVRSGTSLVGEKSSQVIIIPTSGFSTTSSLLQNYVQTGSVDTYPDSRINIIGITFTGNMNALRTVSLITLFKTIDCTISECAIKDNTYMGIAIGGCKDIKITKSVFTGCGKNTTTTEGGAAIWVGDAADGSHPKDIDIIDNLFSNNRWSCAYFMPIGGKFEQNRCFDNGESTLYMNPTGTNISISNNVIRGTVMKSVAAAGIEVWGTNLNIYDNDISYCAKSAIVLGDTQRVIVRGNRLHENGQDITNYPVSSAIELISLPYTAGLASGGAPAIIDISNNIIYDIQGSKTQKYAIQADNYGGGVMTQISIQNNNMFQQGLDTLRLDTGVFGVDCITRGNTLYTGKTQAAFVTKQVAGPSSPSTITISGIGFRPSAVVIDAVVPSASNLQKSTGSFDGTLTSCVYEAAGSGAWTSSVAGNLIYIKSPAGTLLNAADASFNQDGMTISFSTCSVQCYMSLRIYP
jgi:hypothetical protein